MYLLHLLAFRTFKGLRRKRPPESPPLRRTELGARHPKSGPGPRKSFKFAALSSDKRNVRFITSCILTTG
jgi:hypothetical protein